MFLERLYIPILNFLYKFVSKIHQNVRTAILYCMVSIWMISILVSHSMKFIGFVYPETLKCLIGAFVLGVVIVFSMDGSLTKVKWNKVLIYGIFVCGAGMFLTGLLHYIGYSYMLLGLIMAFEFPALFFVWINRADYNSLYTIVARVICLTAVAYFIICIVYAPIGSGQTFSIAERYAGTTSNPNTIGMLSAAFAAAGIYLSFCEKGWFFAIAGNLSFGIAVALVREAASRTGMLTILCMLVVSVIILLTALVKRKEARLAQIIRLILFVVIAITLAKTGHALLEINGAEVVDETGYSNQLFIEHIEPANEETPVADTRVSKGITEEGVDVNHMSSGRIALWKAYLLRLNLLGNDASEKVTYGYGSDAEIQYAHNTALEYGYRSGIVVGGIFIIFEIITGVWALVMTFSARKRNKYVVFSIMSIVCFGIISLLDVAVMPFSSLPLLMYWIGVIPLFEKTWFSDIIEGGQMKGFET